MSCSITVLADVRLIPRPPALVDSRNTNIDLSLLYESMRRCLEKK